MRSHYPLNPLSCSRQLSAQNTPARPLLRLKTALKRLFARPKTPGISRRQAIDLVAQWAGDVAAEYVIHEYQKTGHGGFHTNVKGLAFQFDADRKELRVSGIVCRKPSLYLTSEADRAKLDRVALQEHFSTGGGHFELAPDPFFGISTVLLLSRLYTSRPALPDWLEDLGHLRNAALYWFSRRLLQVMTQDEPALIDEARDAFTDWTRTYKP